MAIQKAIKKDYDDLLEEYSFDEISKMLIRDPKHYFVDEDGKKYYAHAHTAGIQDAMRGLSDGKIKTLWGHSLKYYKRDDMMNEVQEKIQEKDAEFAVLLDNVISLNFKDTQT